MHESQTEVTLIIVISTALILLLGGIVVTGLFIQQKRNHRHQQQLLEINSRYEKSLLESRLKIQEETFQAISQNLHDNIGSNISTTMLLLYKDEQTSSVELESNRKEALGMLSRIVDDLKDIARNLNADYLENIGLNEAVRHRMEQLKRSKKYTIELDLNDVPYRIERQKQVILFYIFQEAITNITKHAQAKEIRVAILYEMDKLTMRIKDNGSGITNIEPGNVNKNGSGLINMKNHAALISADLSINSNSNAGTEIILQVPNPYDKAPNIG
jgi:two-component system NarL family sensor kinase